jgi:hypothetical protein
MRAVVFRSNSRSADTQYASPPSPAIERGCSIGANHAQTVSLTNFDGTRRDRTIWDRSSTFQQAFDVVFS